MWPPPGGMMSAVGTGRVGLGVAVDTYNVIKLGSLRCDLTDVSRQQKLKQMKKAWRADEKV